MTGQTLCPVCGAAIVRIQNDPHNRWHCEGVCCWFASNPMPIDVVNAIRRQADNADWAADNGFWFGITVAAGVAFFAAIAFWWWR